MSFLRNLIALALTLGCAACSITEPVVVIGQNGQMLRGATTAALSGGSFTVTDGKLTCGGSYNSWDMSLTISMPVTCSDGRQGIVIATRDSSGTSGSGNVRLSDGSSSTFLFGATAADFVAPPLAQQVVLPATKEQTDAAGLALASCFTNAAENLDDQRSDATTIAKGIIDECDAEISHVTDALQSTEAETSAAYLQIAIRTVLDERSARPTPLDGTIDEAYSAYKSSKFVIAAGIFYSLAERGSADAQGMLGEMYDNGEGVAKNYPAALYWLQKAVAQSGDPNLEGAIGLMYEYGAGVQQDNATAANWFRKAADQGSSDAKNDLAKLYARFPALRQ